MIKDKSGKAYEKLLIGGKVALIDKNNNSKVGGFSFVIDSNKNIFYVASVSRDDDNNFIVELCKS